MPASLGESRTVSSGPGSAALDAAMAAAWVSAARWHSFSPQQQPRNEPFAAAAAILKGGSRQCRAMSPACEAAVVCAEAA
jgi:hypothetical protein